MVIRFVECDLIHLKREQSDLNKAAIMNYSSYVCVCEELRVTGKHNCRRVRRIYSS